jgi:RHS repeat-associated protein
VSTQKEKPSVRVLARGSRISLRRRNGARVRGGGSALLSTIVIATVVALLPAVPAHAAVKELPKAADVKGVKVKQIAVTPRKEWTASDRELTEDDLPPDSVIPAGLKTSAHAAPRKGVRAGALPVYLAPVASTGSVESQADTGDSDGIAVGKVSVEVLDRRATIATGVAGMVLKLARADGVSQTGQVDVTVDYRALKSALGGDAFTRLRLIRLSDGKLIPSTNDYKSGSLSATVYISSTASQFGVAAAPEGENGDYKATSLTPASTWQVSQQTGSFAWSYPIKAPAAAGGVAPNLSLSYNSGSIDGRTSGNNTQGSWAGDGWDIWPGYIERAYRACAEDRDDQGGRAPNNKSVSSGDLCYFNDNATMSLNGSATELVKVADTGGGDNNTVSYRGITDDGSRIEEIRDGRDNGDVDGVYWRVTTLNGTQYYFGRDKGQGGSSSGTKTNSVWTVPVYSNHPDEDDYDASFAKSRVDRAWRWNLDYAVDPNKNTITYFYTKEQGAYAREGEKDKRTTYDRGGYLDRVEYGSRSDAASSVRPATRIVFKTKDRCLGVCKDKDNKPIARRFPDTPWEQYCEKAPCGPQFSPTFWTQKRLETITTQVYAGSGDNYYDVDSWTLDQTYLQAGDNESTPMWLKSITHTGMETSAGRTQVKDPAVVFNPNADVLPNRVNTPNGHPSLFRSRIETITTESGAQYGITYSKPECDGKPLPKPWDNNRLCFPQLYGADGEKPTLDWFNKYVVRRVDVYDNTGGFEHEQINYDYLDDPAWAYDDSELVKPKKRTWGQYRGYGLVQVRRGVESGVQSRTEYRYFRGMDGDKQPQNSELPPTGVPRHVQVEDSFHDKVDDHPAFAGLLREEITYDGDQWVNGTLNTPVADGPTASRGSLKAWKTHTDTTRKRTKLSNGKTRWTKTVTKVNGDNLTTQVDDLGDEADPDDDRCARTEYARNEATWLLDRVKRVETVGVNCDAKVLRPRDVLSDKRTYYDDPQKFGASPTRGLAVRTEELDDWDGATPKYVTTSRTGYDEVGRVTSNADALNRATITEYVPKTAGPVTSTTITNPLGQATTTVFDRTLGAPEKIIGANGELTQMTYDGAGRLTAVWMPGRDKSSYPNDPSLRYSYRLSKDSASSITTKTLMPSGTKTYRTTVTLYDGLLRSRQTQSQTVAGGRAITDTVYDSRGLIDWSSNPYYDLDNAPPQTTLVSAESRPEIPALTQNQYDGAGRQTKATLLVNGKDKWKTVTVNSGEKTTVIPPSGGIVTTIIIDARGRKSEMRQYKNREQAGSDSTGTFDRASYSFNKRDEMTSVAIGGNTWTYRYDLRGRKIWTSDPDAGESTSTYDAAGQLESSTDGRGKKLAYTYDDLGRKRTTRQDNKSGRILAEWEYDTLPHGIGKLTRSTHYEYDVAGVASAYTKAVSGYDNAGRVKGSSVTIPESEDGLCVSATPTPCTFSETVSYRPNGAVDQVKKPAAAGLPAETLTTLYNEVGLANGLIGNQEYAQDIVYNQLDQLIGQNLGEHGHRIGLTYGFDEATGRQKTFTAVAELKSEIYDLSYTYNDAGSLTAISDNPDENQPAETQCFDYDHLRRLTEAWTPNSGDCATAPSDAVALSGAAPYWRSYTYDPAGNRETETIHGTTGTAGTVRTYTYPASGGGASSKPHAVTKVAATGAAAVTQQYGYDGAGNMTCRPSSQTSANVCNADGSAGADSQAITWNNEGKVANSSDKAGETSYLYDADGNRLIRRDPNGSTLYLPGGTEIRKPKNGIAVGTRYYSHAGATIAVRTATALNWLVNDHQGTSNATVTNDENPVVTRRRSLPFGDVRGDKPSAWPGEKGFVGGTIDNTGLTHLGAREYDPSLGRFISVDPLMDVGDPQQWNAYNYANDTPLSMSDPSGMCGIWGPGDIYCGGGNGGTGGHNGSGGATGGNSNAGDAGTTDSGEPRSDNGNCTNWLCKAGKYKLVQKMAKVAIWVDKTNDAAWDWTEEHKADMIGWGVGLSVGVTCTIVTGGAGAIACGALGGGMSSFAKGLASGQSGKDIAINTASGAVFGAAGGVFTAGVGGMIGGFSLKAGGVAAKEAIVGTRSAFSNLAPKTVGRFISLSKANLALERAALNGSRGRQALAIGKDIGKAAISPSKGLVPAFLGGALPGDVSDLQEYANEGWSFKKENTVLPLLTAGFD